MLSGPQALCGFRFANNLLIPVSLMCIGEGEDLDLCLEYLDRFHWSIQIGIVDLKCLLFLLSL